MTVSATRSNGVTTAVLPFRGALVCDGLSIIAEIKRRSPSRGRMLPAGAAPETLARDYEASGAACLSVLTDKALFGGSSEDLRRARSAVSIPVLRKDFLSTEQDIRESREMGADAVLLIMADLGIETAASLHASAGALGLDAVVEVRTEQELTSAASFGADIIMVNQRDDPRAAGAAVALGRASRMAPVFDEVCCPEVVRVAASGIGIAGGTPIAAVADTGYDAALVGEALSVTGPQMLEG